MKAPFGLVPVHTLGPVAATSLTTSWRGTVRVTVIAKATLAFAPNAEMTLAAPPVEIAREDVYFGNDPSRSVQASSDLFPHIESAEVLFRGHACAPGGVPVPRARVRLGVSGERGVVLDKSLLVIGDRATPAAEPAPFAKMRIGYERAVGGPGNPRNPIGTSDGLHNIGYPDAARAAEPAGFGPLAAAWEARRSILRGREAPSFGGGPAALPDDLAWSYFQSAPFDQRIPELPEQAWILLEGLSAEHPSLSTRLPKLQASVRLYGESRPEATLTLRPDTLFIDGETQRCTVTWRASHPVASILELRGILAAVAAVHPPGQEPSWPATAEEASALGRKKKRHVFAETVVADKDAPVAPALPFQPGAPGLSASQLAERQPPRQADDGWDDTLDQDTFDGERSTLPGPEFPFVASAVPGPPPAPMPAAPAPVPGAPWSAVPAARPALEPSRDGKTAAFRMPDIEPPKMAPPPVAEPPMAPPLPATPPLVSAPPVPPPLATPALVTPPLVTPPPVETPAAGLAPPAPARPMSDRPPPDRLPPDRLPPRPPSAAPPPPAAPAPMAPIPRVPVPSAASRKAYGKFNR